MFRILLALATVGLLTACTPGIRQATSSITPLRSASFEVIAQGASKTLCVVRVFYIGEPPALKDAVKQLVAERGGDEAINIEYEDYVDSVSVILQIATGSLVTNTCVKVKADIIKYR